MILIQAIRNAMVNDLVVRNVADLAAVPTGKPGRPSRSLNLEQALAVLDAARGERLWPYADVSMLCGIRTEEARALRWSEGDLAAGTVAVYRSVSRTGETRTEKSRRVFSIPEVAVKARRGLVLKQAAARGGGRDGVEGERPRVLHEPRQPDVRDRYPDGVQAARREGRPRPGLDGYQDRCRRAGPAVRAQGSNGWRPKLGGNAGRSGQFSTVRLPVRLPGSLLIGWLSL